MTIKETAEDMILSFELHSLPRNISKLFTAKYGILVCKRNSTKLLASQVQDSYEALLLLTS